jgi:pilus assembly protein CpaB
MRMVFGLVLVVGLALAGFAVYMAQGFISQTQNELEQERAIREKTGPLVEVFVANKPLSYGDVLTKEDVQLIYWPENALPETIFRDGEVLFPNDGKEPRYVMRQMEMFEPLLATKVTEPGQPAGLTGQLTKGMRAFAIKVDVESGVSGFLQPGDNVDVYWTGQTSGVEGELTRLIESTIKIVAVDQVANGERANAAAVARTVTVEVSPQQVARLAQAQATGRLALSLVGTGDETVSAGVEVDNAGLLGIEAQQIVAAEEEKVCTIRTRKGGEAVEIAIPCTN